MQLQLLPLFDRVKYRHNKIDSKSLSESQFDEYFY